MPPSPLQSIEDWLNLPELPLPGEGEAVAYEFLDAGILKVLRREALAAGVEEPWEPPFGDPFRRWKRARSRRHGSLLGQHSPFAFLGAVMIKTGEGAEFRRLPHDLTAWALGRVHLAAQRTDVFPCRLRLQATEGSLEITEEELRPLTVYVDESGNTGDAAAGITKSFDGQRAFTLVGVGDDAGPGSIQKILEALIETHGVKATEVKGRAMKRHAAFVIDLVHHVSACSSIFIEIMDKRFQLVTNLVSFVLLDQTTGIGDPFELANMFADILADSLDDTVLESYGTFAREPHQQSFAPFRDAFRSQLLHAKISMRSDQEHEFRLVRQIEAAFEAAFRVCRERADFSGLVPSRDPGKTKRGTVMLPHASAFSNLLARVKRHARPRYPGMHIVHDEQAQFDATLQGYTDLLASEAPRMTKMAAGTRMEAHADWDFAPGEVQLTFANSKLEPGLQVADVIARLCKQRMEALLNGEKPDPGFDRVFQILHDLRSPGSGTGVNIVTTTTMADKFWEI